MTQTKYYFRIKFLLPTGHSFNFEEKRIEIKTNDKSYVLSAFNTKNNKASHRKQRGINFVVIANWFAAIFCPKGRGIEPEKIKDTNILILSGGPFKTNIEAESYGQKAKQALMLSTAELRTGIDLGNDKATGGLSKYFADKIFKESGVKIINDVHGLCVYEDTCPVKFASVGPVNLRIGHGSQNFINAFTKCYEINPNINEKERLAFELYSASYFEPTPRARFLTLVMAIESLLMPKDRTENAQKVIRHIIKYTKTSGLDNSEINSLLGSLQWLQKESISKTGRDLANQYLSKEKYLEKSANKFFTYCYSLRSEMVHQGKTKDENTNINSVVGELQRFVSDLLKKMRITTAST